MQWSCIFLQQPTYTITVEPPYNMLYYNMITHKAGDWQVLNIDQTMNSQKTLNTHLLYPTLIGKLWSAFEW